MEYTLLVDDEEYEVVDMAVVPWNKEFQVLKLKDSSDRLYVTLWDVCGGAPIEELLPSPDADAEWNEVIDKFSEYIEEHYSD